MELFEIIKERNKCFLNTAANVYSFKIIRTLGLSLRKIDNAVARAISVYTFRKGCLLLSFIHLPVKELFPKVYENVRLFQEVVLLYFKLYLRASEHWDQKKATEPIRSLTG